MKFKPTREEKRIIRGNAVFYSIDKKRWATIDECKDLVFKENVEAWVAQRRSVA